MLPLGGHLKIWEGLRIKVLEGLEGGLLKKGKNIMPSLIFLKRENERPLARNS